jgi:hypothetical protein
VQEIRPGCEGISMRLFKAAVVCFLGVSDQQPVRASNDPAQVQGEPIPPTMDFLAGWNRNTSFEASFRESKHSPRRPEQTRGGNLRSRGPTPNGRAQKNGPLSVQVQKAPEQVVKADCLGQDNGKIQNLLRLGHLRLDALSPRMQLDPCLQEAAAAFNFAQVEQGQAPQDTALLADPKALRMMGYRMGTEEMYQKLHEALLQKRKERERSAMQEGAPKSQASNAELSQWHPK